MLDIKIKPLSVNEVWQGKRFKTKAYKRYERDLSLLLPRTLSVDLNGKLEVNLEFGFSNPDSDIDNPVKPVLDILQKKYGFNDNKIYSLTVKKFIVKKGEEFIRAEIKSYET